MEQQLFFISSIAGILLLANIMGYYIFKFKRNFETEQANRIKSETESEQLQHELTKTRAELEENQNKINRLQDKFEATQASKIQYQTMSEQLQRELNTTQVELEETQTELRQKQNQVNQLEENLEAERESWITESEQLQRELNTTQAELREKQNQVNHLEENLQTQQESRIQYQTESERLQRELSTSQAELKQKESEVSQLQENLQAEQAESGRLQHELSTIKAELEQKEMEVNQLEENLEAERESWITESEQLQCELNTTQAELREKQNQVNHLEENLQTQQESRIQYQTESERLQRELSTSQAELKQKESEVSRLQQNLQAEQAESERLQHELNTTKVKLKQTQRQIYQLQQDLQAGQVESERLQQELNANQVELEETQAELEQKQNEVKHFEKNLKAEQAECEQLQRELNKIQEELQGKENKVNRLEENLQAEQESRIKYETESQQLQHELATIYQTELDKQKNIISRLEEDLKAEQQSRMLYEKKVEKLQHELAITQAELNNQKKEVTHLQEKNKEQADNRASTEQSDIQEIEENPTDPDDPQSQEGTDDSPSDLSNSEEDSTETDTIGEHSETDTAGGAQKPRDIKGRRGEQPNVPEGSTNHQAEYNPKPELICKKNGWQWEILLIVPEEQPPIEVRQNGVPLSSANGEYQLNDFSENLTVMYEDSKETVKVYNGKSPLIFKLRKRWTGDGRKVKGISSGHFIVFAPYQWQRKGNPPVAQEACRDERFLAHYFYFNSSVTADSFEEHKLPSNREVFSLRGSSIYDDSEQGPLFIGDPPNLEIEESVSWVRIGAEGGGNWRGRNFDPMEDTVSDVLEGRQGWFYVRVYDQNVNLIDSDGFRYSRALREIRVNDAIYSEEMLLAPCTDGYPETIIQFINTEGNNIRPEQSGSNSHASIGKDDAVIVEPHPDGDSTEWNVDSVATVIVLPRVWWRIAEAEESLDVWHDKPIDMSREEFRENEDAVVHISVPSNIEEIQAGFGSDLDRSYSATLVDENENKHIFELPIRDFVDYEEIDTRLLEDTHLQVQCSREVIPIIRVPAEEPSLKKILVNDIIYSAERLLVPSTDGYTETISIRFIDAEGQNIRPQKKGNSSRASICDDGAVIITPLDGALTKGPDSDLTRWKVESIDTVVILPRVWWRITKTDDFSEGWCDKPIVISRQKFRRNMNAVVQISLPSSVYKIQAKFGSDFHRSYSYKTTTNNKNKHIFELPIRDLDYKEIEKPSSKGTHLNIQCNGKVLPIIRVPAEGEVCPKCDSNRLTKINSEKDKLMWYQCQHCHWESTKYPQSAIQITEEQR